jgi:hypothetical protein
MKKAKIMLTAIAVLAVVGGALAFKANTVSQGFSFYTCTNQGIDANPSTCILEDQVNSYTTTLVGLATTGTITDADGLQGLKCDRAENGKADCDAIVTPSIEQ